MSIAVIAEKPSVARDLGQPLGKRTRSMVPWPARKRPTSIAAGMRPHWCAMYQIDTL